MIPNWRSTLTLALLTSALALPVQQAFAEDHDDGTHTDGGGGPGGNGNGNGGHNGNGAGGNGHGQVSPVLAAGTDNGGLTVAAPKGGPGNPGTYFRFDLGSAQGAMGDAFWQPPGYPADPEVHFDLTGGSSITGSIAVGRYFAPNLRGEVAVSVFGDQNISGVWDYTVPTTAGPHASVVGAVRSAAVMLNGYYDFPSVDGTLTPFVTAGIGAASNTMSDWTRINPDVGRTTRSFEGGQNADVAWSVGLGASLDVSAKLGRPATLDFSYRYFDLGQAIGGTTPLPGSGAGGDPVTGLTVNVRQQVIGIGLTFPLGG